MGVAHRTPPEAIDGTVREAVRLDGYTLSIDSPADPDGVLGHPTVVAAGRGDEYLPHWVRLWPAARMLAGAVVRGSWEGYPPPVRVLEVGCGLGLAGVACLARGLDVTFSDVDETALHFAAANARLNGFTRFRTRPLDFRDPPPGEHYPLVIGSDLIYQGRLVTPLVAFLRAVLAPGGVCLVADPDRPDARRFGWELRAAGFAVEADAVEPDDVASVLGTVYRIRSGGTCSRSSSTARF